MKILYIERKPHQYVSLEKVFRQIAASLPERFETAFQQLPYGLRPLDTIRNLLFFRKGHADIYHITGHVNYIALLFSPRNTALTVHDVRIIHTNKRLRKAILVKLYLELPIRRLKYVTTVSEHIKREIIENTGCDPAQIRVIELPVTAYPSATPRKEIDRSEPVLLQVGSTPNKNIERLVAAVTGLNCRLRIIGALSKAQTCILQRSGVKYSCVSGLTEKEMANEYDRADIVTFCSTYEGFGLPIIEGQAAGRPVVTSNISPMSETAGGAACLVDPFDLSSMREGILRVIVDDNYRSTLITAGLENVKRFRADQVSAEYAKLYDEIARGNTEVQP